MRLPDGAVRRARAVFAAVGPVPSDAVIEEAITAALRQEAGSRPAGGRPSSREIAAYAVASITCRGCGVKAGGHCPRQPEAWQVVCKERFADAAREFVPRRKNTSKPAGGAPASALVGITRPAVPVPADDGMCPF